MNCKFLPIVMLFWCPSMAGYANKLGAPANMSVAQPAGMQPLSANLAGKDLPHASGAADEAVAETTGFQMHTMASMPVTAGHSNLKTSLSLEAGKKEIFEGIRVGQTIRLERKSVAIPIGQQRKLSQTGIRLSWHFGR